MKIRLKVSLLGVKISVGVQPAKTVKPASEMQLQLVEQNIADLEAYVVEKIGGNPAGEPARLGFGFTTVSEEELDPDEVEDEWFEDDDYSEED